jgi:V8-like Glu-specific endopeptidase
MTTAGSKTPRPRPAAILIRAGATAAVLLLQACAAPPPPESAPEAAPVPPAAPPARGAPPALDGRLQVDAQEYPWSAIGRLNLAGRGFCNGILIGPQQVLTQARCLYAAREGRWYQPLELHFIAAYQSDSYLADSPVESFTAAPGFNAAGGTSLSNITNNWAVVTLRAPIGRTTGWLGVEWDNAGLQDAAAAGEAAYLRAGYRRDWAHAISLYFGCGATQSGLASTCSATPSELALPAFVLSEGELRVLGDHYVRSPDQGDDLARLTATRISGDRLGRASPPAGSATVGQRPSATVQRLLEALGYEVTGGDIDAAAAAFLRDRGRSARSGASLELLTLLLAAAQDQSDS